MTFYAVETTKEKQKNPWKSGGFSGTLFLSLMMRGDTSFLKSIPASEMFGRLNQS